MGMEFYGEDYNGADVAPFVGINTFLHLSWIRTHKELVQTKPDVAPLTRTCQYSDKADEEMFANSVNLVKEKLDKNLKININEAITAYSALIVSSLREGKSPDEIQKNASRLLRRNKS
jgi:hypothetical protein